MSTETIEESVEQTPLERLIQQTDGDIEKIWDYVSASLAFLTLRAAMDAPFIIRNDNEAEAVVAFAVGEDAAALVEALPANFKDFNDPIDEDKATEFLTDVDPGDEQPDHEPAA